MDNKPDYKPNSYKSKEETNERKRVNKVVVGTAKSKKKNELQKFASTFISDDVTNMKSYIVEDVLRPALKKTVSDMVGGIVNIIRDSVDTRLFGAAAVRKNKNSSSKVSYRSFYDKREDRDDRRQTSSQRATTRFDYNDVIFDSRGDAEAVLSQMDDIIDEFGVVSVLDLFDMADLTAPYTGDRYGWTDIRSAKVIRVREGYIINLPKALPIKY